jgi:hypothetical protein
MVIESKTIKIWTASQNKGEFTKMRRLLGSSELKNTLNDEKISEALLKNAVTKISNKDSLLIIHDPCDIRKEHSEKSEDLGKVRDLDGNVINGYCSFNSIAIDLDKKNITLLDTKIFSNKSDNFICQNEIKRVNKVVENSSNSISDEDKEIKEKIDIGDAINNTIIAKNQIEKISKEFKTSNPDIVLTHILDRGFDSNEIFDFIKNDINDQFVIRLKLSRTIDKINISDAVFPYQANVYYSKIDINGKLYQDVCCILEYGLDINNNSVVKVQLLDRKKQPIFKIPMFLITN